MKKIYLFCLFIILYSCSSYQFAVGYKQKILIPKNIITFDQEQLKLPFYRNKSYFYVYQESYTMFPVVYKIQDLDLKLVTNNYKRAYIALGFFPIIPLFANNNYNNLFFTLNFYKDDFQEGDNIYKAKTKKRLLANNNIEIISSKLEIQDKKEKIDTINDICNNNLVCSYIFPTLYDLGPSKNPTFGSIKPVKEKSSIKIGQVKKMFLTINLKYKPLNKEFNLKFELYGKRVFRSYTPINGIHITNR